MSKEEIQRLCKIYSFRDYKVGEFKRAYKECNRDTECEVAVRKCYRSLESGRLFNFIDRLHVFLSAMDQDEIQLFKKMFPNLIDMVDDYAVVEDLRIFGSD